MENNTELNVELMELKNLVKHKFIQVYENINPNKLYLKYSISSLGVCLYTRVLAKVPFVSAGAAPPAEAPPSISGSASRLGFTPVARGVFL